MCVCQRQHIIHLMAFFLHVRCDMFLTHAFSEWQAKCKTIPTYLIVAMEFLISEAESRNWFNQRKEIYVKNLTAISPYVL